MRHMHTCPSLCMYAYAHVVHSYGHSTRRARRRAPACTCICHMYSGAYMHMHNAHRDGHTRAAPVEGHRIDVCNHLTLPLYVR